MPTRVRVSRVESHGNALRTVQEENDGWLRLFSPTERKKSFQQSFRRALADWRAEFLWRRVSASSVKSAPFNYRLGGNTPMVGPHKGKEKLLNVVGFGRITVTVPSAKKETSPLKIVGNVSFPMGHAVPPEIRAVFLMIPPDEIRWLARRWQKYLSEIQEGRQFQTKGVNKGRFKLSAEQRAEFAGKGGFQVRGISGSSVRRR